MPKLNQYYTKNIEKLPKTEQIVYLDQNYQPQSYEEFMKTYEPSEKVEILTEAEYQDRLLHGPQYGPGNEQSKAAAKEIGGTALTTLTIVCPPAGLAVGGGVAGAGVFTAAVGAIDKDPECIKDGFDVFAIGMGSVVKGALGSSSHKGYVCSLPICPKK